jgi:hypothetical protein
MTQARRTGHRFAGADGAVRRPDPQTGAGARRRLARPKFVLIELI